MAGYGGFFLQGVAGGLQSGFEMGWKKKQKKELEAQQKKIAEEGTILGNAVQDMMEDKVITDDEMIKYNALLMASSKEVQDMSKGWTESIKTMNKEGAEQYKEKFEMFGENIGNFDLKDFESSYQEAVKLFPNQKVYFDAAYNIIKRKSEKPDISQELDISAKLPEEYRYPYLKEKGIVGEITPTEEAPKEPSAADRKLDMVVDQYAKDLITFTQLSKFLGTYITPEKATGLEKQIQDIKTQGKAQGLPQDQIKTAIKNKILGISGVGDKEGEISAGEKRTFDMVSSVMFGSSDWVTGISKPGIISQSISNKLNMGQSLTEEEKSEVRNNYNAIKDTFPDEVRTGVESQLQRFGIPLEVTAPPQPIMEGPISKPEDKPGIIEKGVDKVKSLLGVGGTPPTGEVPTPKVSPGAKEAQIPLMTKEELEEAIRGLNPKDPMYKLLYAEAVKRGYITK